MTGACLLLRRSPTAAPSVFVHDDDLFFPVRRKNERRSKWPTARKKANDLSSSS